MTAARVGLSLYAYTPTRTLPLSRSHAHSLSLTRSHIPTRNIPQMSSVNNSTERVAVKNDRGEYYVLCAPGQCEKWRKDKSIAIVDVVEAFDVFAQHHVKGEPDHPTKAELVYVACNPLPPPPSCPLPP